jgi:peroxiredoxin
VSIVAVSVDTPEDSQRLAEEKGIYFPLLSDPDRDVMDRYGVADQDDPIAVPAIFLVGQDGTILWRQVGEFIGKRPRPSTLLEVIDAKNAEEPAD